MSSTNKTTYYELPQFVDNDIFNPLVDDNDAYNKIDTALHNIADAEADNTSDIVSIKSRLDSAEGDIDALETQNGNDVLTTTAQTLSGAVNELDAETDALDGRLDIVEDDINNASTGLKVKVGALETQNGNEVLTTTEQTLSGAINELNNTKLNITDYVIIKPEDYGAIGDGITDDSDALIACFANSGGNKIILLSNTYLVTKQIPVLSNTIVFGNGVGTIIDNFDITGISEMNDRATFLLDNVANIEIKGVNFRGTGALTAYVPKYLFLMQQCDKCSFINCSFTNYSGVGVIYARGCKYIVTSHCYIKDYTRGAIEYVEGTSYSKIEYNTIIDGHETNTGNRYPIMLCGYDQEYDQDHPAPQGSYLWCIGNYVYDTDPWWEGIDAHGGSHIYVYGNIVENIACPISIFTNQTRGFSAYEVYVFDNDFIATTTATTNPATKYGNAFGGSRFFISNNRFRNGGKAYPDPDSCNIFFDRGYSIDFHDNIVENGQGHSIFFSGAFNSCKFHDNDIDAISGGSAIRFNTGSAMSFGKMIFSNNMMDGAGKHCIAPASKTTANQLIKFINNQFGTKPNFDNIAYLMCDKLTATQIAGTTVGNDGDICVNVTPTAGEPFGWIMSNSTQGNGTWIPLATI